jgi:hypothetical protein
MWPAQHRNLREASGFELSSVLDHLAVGRKERSIVCFSFSPPEHLHRSRFSRGLRRGSRMVCEDLTRDRV